MSFTVGDTSPDLTGTCSTQVGTTKTPAPITGAALALHIKKPSGATLTKTGTVVNGAAGTWRYTWLTGELDVDGNWVYEVQVTYSGGGIQTFGPDTFYVAPQIA